MKIKKILVAAVVAAATLGGPVSALTFTMNGPAAGSYESVRLNVSGFQPGSVSSGAFSLTDTTTPNSVFGNFVAFCLDLAARSPRGSDNYYSITSNPFTRGIALASGALSRIQAIFDANYSEALATGDSKTSAAFQVALWNAVYDDDYDVGTGSFQASNNADVVSLANQYLTAASNYGGDQKWDLSYLQNENRYRDRRQNLVTASPVPLPAAGLMLIGALGGLALVRRRRQMA